MLYALLTENCNLGCRYCNLSDRYGEEEWREDSFFSSLESFKNDKVILMGGEPTLYKSRLFKALDMCKNASIASNLIFCDREVLDRIYDRNIITTFRLLEKPLMTKWIDNIKYLTSKDSNIEIEVVLDWFMLGYLSGTVDFEKVIDSFIIENKISLIFVPIVGIDADESYFKIYDNTLYKLLKNHVEEPERYLNIQELKDFKKDCSNMHTLYPNGKLVNGCPYKVSTTSCDDCLRCNRKENCKPCKLQRYCSFPKNTYNKLFNANNL